ncbi:MAG: phosphopantothenoylcysteine decarboxylase, partial [Anaerovoracaceae bacterium]
IKSKEDILDILVNPDCQLDDSSKISSYQPNLTVKLGMTPKIIARLREWFPKAKLFGFKLLENVDKKELFQVAQELCIKNKVDYIMANDLADLRAGSTTRYPISKTGLASISLDTAMDMFNFIDELVPDRIEK